MLLRDRFGADQHRAATNHSNEMAASMFIPTFGVIGLLRAGLVEETGTLLVIEHVVMLPSMLAAMLLRRDEYSHAAHGHRQAEHAIAS